MFPFPASPYDAIGLYGYCSSFILISPQEMGGQKVAVEGVTGRMLSDLKGIKTPTPQLGEVFAAVLKLIEPKGDCTWEEARKAMSDSRKFIKNLEKTDPQDVPEETIASLLPFTERDHSGLHPTARALAKWVIDVVTAPHEALKELPRQVEEPRMTTMSTLSSACVVLGPAPELPLIRLTDTTATILKKSGKLWTSWCPQPSIPIFEYDQCFWGASRKLDMQISPPQQIYESTAGLLVHSALSGSPACLCVTGPSSSEYLYGKDGCLKFVLQDLRGEDAHVDISLMDISGEVVKDVLADAEVQGGKFNGSTIEVSNDADLASLIKEYPCFGHRVVSLSAKGTAVLHVVQLDVADNKGLAAVHNWAVATKGGGTRLATHAIQRLAADAFGQQGHVMLVCAITPAADELTTIPSLSYTQLSKEQKMPPPITDEIDPLAAARADIGSLRKTELAQLRAIVPSPPIQAAAEAALLCLGTNPSLGWEGIRSSLCNPNLIRKMKEHYEVVTLPDSSWRRLQVMLRRCEALPTGTQEDPQEVVMCGVAMGQWASAVVANGLVKQRTQQKDSHREKVRARREEREHKELDSQVSCDEEDPRNMSTNDPPMHSTTVPVPLQQTPSRTSSRRSSVVDEKERAPPTPQTRPLTPVSDALPAEVKVPEEPKEETVEDEEGLLQQLRLRVESMETTLVEKDRLLVALQHREERLESEKHKRGMSPPPASTSQPSSQHSIALQKEVWQSHSHSPRLEQQAVTAHQSSQLRQRAWKELVRLAKREIAEQELLQVSYETLLKLISLYKLDKNPIEACRIELYWKEMNWKGDGPFIPEVECPVEETNSKLPGFNPRKGSDKHFVGQTVVVHQRPKRAASPKSPRVASIEQPIPHTPETVKNKVRGGVREREAALSGAAMLGGAEGVDVQVAAPSNVKVATSVNDIGELQKDRARRRKDAPIAYSDPNMMAAVNARFEGTPDESINAIRQREAYAIDGNGSILPFGSRAQTTNPNTCSEPAPQKCLTRHAPQSPVPCDPNATLAIETPSRLSKGCLNTRGGAAAPCDPNSTLSTAAVDVHSVPTGNSLVRPVEAFQKRKVLRTSEPVYSDPNTASDELPYSRPQRMMAPPIVGADPNTISGEEGVVRHRAAQELDRSEGDKVFRQGHGNRDAAGCNPNGIGRESPLSVVGSGGGRMRLAPAENEQKQQAIGRKAIDAPGMRHGEAAHPLHGFDPVTMGNRTAVSRSMTSELGILRADINSETQRATSPHTRKRHHPQPVTSSIIQ
eukprot:TRINITY_DN2834_c1_g4_i3.p1 TRINITY_DN2834_c1_g4~~TRINITY_DN2834_c1_g4_i3.p1  ORF type:complete len:1267 (+),score=273.40 TRINITY_DN2834_c1_g4_i3:3254-7054(+)